MEANVTSADNIRVIEVKSSDGNKGTQNVFVRLTPTGKISQAKTRVYTQRYRKEWEHMPDFKDWLTSVPCQATRAFCKYCQRNLHAHRLSLLKHMCTLKHQRAAVMYKRNVDNKEDKVDDSEEANYEEEKSQSNSFEEEITYEDATYVQEVEGSAEAEIEEEIVLESDGESESSSKKPRVEIEEQDPLARAMAHVEGEYLTENDESIQLEMVVESDDNDEEKTYFVNCEDENEESEVKEITIDNEDEMSTDNSSKKLENKNIVLSSDNSKKVYFFSTGGKSYTLLKGEIPQIVLDQAQKNVTVVSNKSEKSELNIKDIKVISASTSEDVTINKISKNVNTQVPAAKSKKVMVSTNVLDTSKGVPVCGLQVSLYKLQDGRWTFVHETTTNASGDCSEFSNIKCNVTTGRYKFHYDTEKYYAIRKIPTSHPFIEIVFDIKDPNQSYHVPLHLSPFSYSTYKSTHK